MRLIVRVWHARAPRWLLLTAGALGAVLWPSVAFATPRPSWHPGPMYAPLAPHSGEVNEISNLFWIMLVLSGIIFVGVTAALILSAVRYTGKAGDPDPPQVFGNRRVELIWTIIPTVILMLAFVATVKAIHDINTPEKGLATLDVDVIGHQWWWEFRYSKYSITTANEIHLPTGINIHFHIGSNDVIHSFWTPQLQRQVDANPGQDNAVFVKLTQPGIYAGACYEYCGEAHAWMKYRMVVQTPAQFAAWAKAQSAPASKPSGLAAQGQKVFAANTCVSCHAIEYRGSPANGTVGPNLTHFASRWTIGAGAAPNDTSDLISWIRDPTTYKPGVLMPGFTKITNKDITALAAYLESLK